MLKRKYIECDLCVVGGGMAGMAAAISAAREGLRVVLMHERPVLGGNASSEIRMWICGAKGENNRETGILEEIFLENLYRNPTKNYAVWDTVLYDFVRRERNITLLLNCTCMDAQVDRGSFADGREVRIRTVTGYQMTTQSFYEIKAAYFCDSSGDSILAPLTGAKYRWGRESGEEYGEMTSTQVSDSMTMGMSCLLYGRETDKKIKYIAPEWSAKLTEKDFEHRKADIYDDYTNFWYLELGGERDTIADSEELRDELLGLATGTWDYIKNSGKYAAENWDLDFLGFLPGKRESRRMVGEYTVTQRDISLGKVFDDEVAYGGWQLDDHFPGGFYHRGKPTTNIPTASPYSLPYRALYSANVENLFFAGRNISMTHMAMSSMQKNDLVESIYLYPRKIVFALLRPLDMDLEEISNDILDYAEKNNKRKKNGQKYTREDILHMLNDSARAVMLSMFDHFSELATSPKSFELLINKDIQDISEQLERLLIIESAGNTDRLVKEAEALLKIHQRTEYDTMIKLIVRKHLITNKELTFSKRQQVIDKIFGKENRKYFLVNNKE